MNTTEQILLIILSSALAVLVVLSIIAVAYSIKFISSLRRIAAKAESVVDSAESVASTLKHSVTPISIFHFVKSVMNIAQKNKSKK